MPGGHVAVHLAVAVGEVDVADQARQLGRRRRTSSPRGGGARCRRSRGRPGWSISLTKRTSSCTSFSSASLNGSSSSTISRPFECAYSPASVDHVLRQVPDRRAREDLAVPVVLADDEQDVARAEVRALVDVRLDAVEREAAHRRVEVDEPEARRRRRERIGRPASSQAALISARSASVDVERILEDVVGVEADLLGLADAFDATDLACRTRSS